MPPNHRPSVSTLTQRAPPAAYSRGQLGRVGDLGELPLRRRRALDLGDHADAGRAQRRVGVARRRRRGGQLLDPLQRHLLPAGPRRPRAPRPGSRRARCRRRASRRAPACGSAVICGLPSPGVMRPMLGGRAGRPECRGYGARSPDGLRHNARLTVGRQHADHPPRLRIIERGDREVAVLGGHAQPGEPGRGRAARRGSRTVAPAPLRAAARPTARDVDRDQFRSPGSAGRSGSPRPQPHACRTPARSTVQSVSRARARPEPVGRMQRLHDVGAAGARWRRTQARWRTSRCQVERRAGRSDRSASNAWQAIVRRPSAAPRRVAGAGRARRRQVAGPRPPPGREFQRVVGRAGGQFQRRAHGPPCQPAARRPRRRRPGSENATSYARGSRRCSRSPAIPPRSQLVPHRAGPSPAGSYGHPSPARPCPIGRSASRASSDRSPPSAGGDRPPERPASGRRRTPRRPRRQPAAAPAARRPPAAARPGWPAARRRRRAPTSASAGQPRVQLAAGARRSREQRQRRRPRGHVVAARRGTPRTAPARHRGSRPTPMRAASPRSCRPSPRSAHRAGRSVSAAAIAASTAAALLRVSVSSAAGSESATMPAPACT